jgi:putative intracellular protease/amidase
MKPVAIALPDRDFDLTEVVVPWRTLRDAGVPVVFATERGPEGPAPTCDPMLIESFTLKVIGGAAKRPYVALWRELERAPERLAPIRWAEIEPAKVQGLVLPGGHWKRGMRQYLEGAALQAAVLRVVKAALPLAAICHGPVVLARTIDPATGKSVVAGRKLAALPRFFEMLAWCLSAPFLGDYYRTYPESVESEVRRALGPEGTFVGSGVSLPFFRALRPGGLVVTDGELVTARWPGDAERWARAFVDLLRTRGT